MSEGFTTKTYTISAKPEQLNVLEALFRTMEMMGTIGASRTIILYVDGDGDFHPKIEANGKKIENTIYDKDFGYGYIKKECEITTSNNNVTYKDPNFNIYYDLG